MRPVIIIDTFEKIYFEDNEKPLVICDIDFTLITSKYDYEYYYNIYRYNYKYKDINNINNAIKNMQLKCIEVGLVKQTDEKGFKQLIEKVNELKGKIVLLTSRSLFSHSKTISDLTYAGFENPENFEIHYTGATISKGDYIKNNNLWFGYKQIIFIDDMPINLNSALNIPNIACYLFCDPNSIIL